ncbi:MAG: hypothetical protein JXB39_14310 [Deltaproteobacteria bacterium]|nr:hypothetical protein [Deltaproteobacteria bacterium]
MVPPVHADRVLEAVRRLAATPDPGALSDGLSAPMAARCLDLACGLITREALLAALDVPGVPPRTAAVVGARGVFTASLEWVALLAGAGAEVVLKAPAAAPHFGRALAAAFTAESLPVRCTTDRALPDTEAIVAMGDDASIAAIAATHARARLALHGHRTSLALVEAPDPETLAAALALDTLLYDGRGCFTPAAVLVVGPPQRAADLAEALGRALTCLRADLPLGDLDPLHGPAWRHRTGLARVLGRLYGTDAPGAGAAGLLPAAHLDLNVVPGFLAVHSVASVAEAAGRVRPWLGHLAACATDLADPAQVLPLGVERACRPGRLQTPPFGRTHGGLEPLRMLCAHPSIEP